MSWLLQAPEPAVRDLARRELLGEDIAPEPAAVIAGPWAPDHPDPVSFRCERRKPT